MFKWSTLSYFLLKDLWSRFVDWIIQSCVLKNSYIHRRIRIFCWYWRTHGCLGVRKSFLDTWFCKPAKDKWFPGIVCHDQRSRLGRGNWIPEEIRHIQTAATNHSIDREYLRKSSAVLPVPAKWAVTKKVRETSDKAREFHFRSAVHFCPAATLEL